MIVAGVPFLEEGLKTYVTQRAILRTYVIVVCVLAVALLVVWPQGSLEGVYRGARASDTFAVVSVTFLLLLLYLGGRFGGEDYSPETLVNLREYAALTPASVAWLVAGKTAFAVVHTIFLLLLGSPFLLAAASVSGAPAGSFGRALVLVGAATLASRMYGLFLLGLFGQRRILRGAAFLAGLAVFLAGTWLLLPALNPVSVLLGQISTPSAAAAPGGAGPRGALSPATLLALADGVLSLLLAALTTLVLVLARHEARRGGGADD